jgi:dTDP-glucose pyrophosphorylase
MKGDHWSFVKINRQGFATQVTEKRRISPHCSVGSYYFKRYDDFKFIYKKYINEIKKVYREAYIAPMYQYLINRDKKVNILCMNKSDIISLGTPDEVIKFDKNYLSHNS